MLRISRVIPNNKLEDWIICLSSYSFVAADPSRKTLLYVLDLIYVRHFAVEYVACTSSNRMGMVQMNGFTRVVLW